MNIFFSLVNYKNQIVTQISEYSKGRRLDLIVINKDKRSCKISSADNYVSKWYSENERIWKILQKPEPCLGVKKAAEYHG